MIPTSTTTVQIDTIYISKPVAATDITAAIIKQQSEWLDNLQGRYKLASTMAEFRELEIEREAVGKFLTELYSRIDLIFNA
jgi:hypothetical protein